MPSFGITPASGYPPATDQGFPRFIQWQVNGEDVGSRALVETVNLVGNVEGTVNSGGDTLTARISGMTWTEFGNDRTLSLVDANQALASTGNSGVQYVTVPAEGTAEFDAGDAVLILQDGGAQVQVRAESGVELIYRPSAFNPHTAGEGAAITLVYRGNDRWLVTGDLEAV